VSIKKLEEENMKNKMTCFKSDFCFDV
jgi:hypothetical protein